MRQEYKEVAAELKPLQDSMNVMVGMVIKTTKRAAKIAQENEGKRIVQEKTDRALEKAFKEDHQV